MEHRKIEEREEMNYRVERKSATGLASCELSMLSKGSRHSGGELRIGKTSEDARTNTAPRNYRTIFEHEASKPGLVLPLPVAILGCTRRIPTRVIGCPLSYLSMKIMTPE